MLLHLRVSNLATIQDLEIELAEGFTILTGETGAGKSIIIDAIQLITGKKADYGMVRTGEKKATVEAAFDIQRLPVVQQILKDTDIPCEESELIVRRVIQSNGRQRTFLNDVNVGVTKLEEIGKLLVNVHGQHDNQALLRVGPHLYFLDGFAQLVSLRETVGTLFHKYQDYLNEHEALKARLAERTARIEELSFQRKELEEADLKKEEEEALEQEAYLLNHSERLKLLCIQAQKELYDQDGSLVERVGALEQSMREAEKIDTQCYEFRRSLETCLFQLEDVHRAISSYTTRIEEDPQRLEWINQRLSLIQSLKRKYGVSTIALILDHLNRVKLELKQLGSLEETEEALIQKIKEVKAELHEKATKLSELRKREAKKLDKQIMAELHQLGMEKAIFQTTIAPRLGPDSQSSEPHYTPIGIDHVEFELSVNPGQQLRSLTKVASGGELSRIMLALKTVLASVDTVETLIFDEIDTGISGRVAEIVGQKLRSLGNAAQTLCITHLPQIAAFSENHFGISKSVKKGATYTSVLPLNQKEKVQELARLIGGTEITPQTHTLAAEMIERSEQKFV